MKNDSSLKVVIMVGDNRSGKTTLAKKLEMQFPEIFVQSISTTSRDIRINLEKPEKSEVEGVDYYFVKDESIFNKENFIEFEAFVDMEGNTTYYGTGKAELAKAYLNNKVLVLVLEPKGAKNFYENIHEIEVDGRAITLDKTFVVLDIPKEMIYAQLEKEIDKEKEPARFEAEKKRADRGNITAQMKMFGIANYEGNNVVRKEYLPENYLSDILDAMPSRVKKAIRNELKQLQEQEHKAYLAFSDVLRHKKYEDTPDSEMRDIIKHDRIDTTLVNEIAQLHNIPPNEILKFAKEHLEFPMYWRDPNGYNSDKCRISNPTLLRELIEDTFSQNENVTLSELLEVSVGGHTRHGYEDAMQLKDIQGFSLKDLGVSDELIERTTGNEIVKKTRDKNRLLRESRGTGGSAEKPTPKS